MKKTSPKNVTALKECLMRIWKRIEIQVCKKLVDSVPNRFHEVCRMTGFLQDTYLSEIGLNHLGKFSFFILG